eukprot:5420121-Amphidinium_carterae.1
MSAEVNLRERQQGAAAVVCVSDIDPDWFLQTLSLLKRHRQDIGDVTFERSHSNLNRAKTWILS